jgi:Berberine and berberine like
VAATAGSDGVDQCGGSKPHRDLTRAATPDFPGEMVQNPRAWRRIAAVRATVRSPARRFFAAPSEYWRAGRYSAPRAHGGPAVGWGSLASSIGGGVLLPANGAQFATGKQVFNSFYDNSNPTGSDVIGQVNSAAAHAIATAIGQWPASGGQASVFVDPLGGAVGDVAAGDTALPWRQQSAVLQWYVEPVGSQVAAANTWLTSAHQAVQQFSVGGYVNYLEPNASPARYFGSNLSGLTSVRQKYDPNRIMFSGLNF